MHFVELQNLQKHRAMDETSSRFTLMMTCFSPLTLNPGSRSLKSELKSVCPI